MKKIIALLLALVMVMSLAACGAKEEAKTDAPAVEEGTTIKVAAIETAYGS